MAYLIYDEDSNLIDVLTFSDQTAVNTFIKRHPHYTVEEDETGYLDDNDEDQYFIDDDYEGIEESY